MTDALLACTDGLRQYVEGLKRGQPESRQFNRLAHQLLAAQAGETAAAAEQSVLPAEAPPQRCGARSAKVEETVSAALWAQVSVVSTGHESTLAGRATFQPNLALVGLKARLVYEKLANLGELCYFHPPAEGLDELESVDGISFGLATDKPLSEVQQKLRIAGVERATVEPLLERADEPGTPICGGGCMFNTTGPLQIGDANIEAVAAVLEAAGLRVVARDVGGTAGRRVALDCSTGHLTPKPRAVIRTSCNPGVFAARLRYDFSARNRRPCPRGC